MAPVGYHDAMKDLFVTTPTIQPNEYLSPSDVQKLAGIKITSVPSFWDDEITQNLLRDHPYIPSNRVVVNFKRKDEAQGTAIGYVSINGAPHISLPIVMRRRELSPIDVMVLRTNTDSGIDQGVGDMSEDKTVPLTEESFNQALDTGSIGDPIHESKVRGTGYTEDGSLLRLPFRGRTVIASVIGASPEKKAEFEALLGSDKAVVAGFLNNGTESVVDSWLNAPLPVNIVQSKLASSEVKKAVASFVAAVPQEVKSAQFLAANVFVDGGATKVAVAFDAVNLANPEGGLERYFLFQDGSHCKAPEKVAVLGVETPEGEAALTSDVMKKWASPSVGNGMTVSFILDDIFTVPAKIASIAFNEEQRTLSLRMQDELSRKYDVLLDPRVKAAVFENKTATWILPATTHVIHFSGVDGALPLPMNKIAEELAQLVPDSLVCSGGQFTLSLGKDAFGPTQCSEEKISSVLNHWFENGDAILQAAKTDGVIRFNSNLTEQATEISKLASQYNDYPKIAAQVVEKIAMPLPLAVKLAAAIGDPDGVDAILSSGFLNQDNLAQFVGQADQFEDTVAKLARVLLAIRMGFPGDESATMVAMKSLQRVAERLKSAVQEVGA